MRLIFEKINRLLSFSAVMCVVSAVSVASAASDNMEPVKASFMPDGSIMFNSLKLTMSTSAEVALPIGDGACRFNLFLFARPDGRWSLAKNLVNQTRKINADKKEVVMTGDYYIPSQKAPLQLSWGYRLGPANTVVIFVKSTVGNPKDYLKMVRISLDVARNLVMNRVLTIDDTPVPRTVTVIKKGEPEKSVRLYQGKPETITLPLGDEYVLDIASGKMFAEINDRRLQSRKPYFDVNLHPSLTPDNLDASLTVSLRTKAVSGTTSPKNPYLVNGVDFSAGKLLLPDFDNCRNLTQNPGFEQGFHYWSNLTLGTVTASAVDDYYRISEDGAYEGKRCLKIVAEPGQSPTALGMFTVPVNIHKPYVFSFYAKGNRPECLLSVSSHTGEWPVFPCKGNFRLTTEWKRYSLAFEAPNGLVTIGFSPSPKNQKGAIMSVDAVQFEPGSVASEFVRKPFAVRLTTPRRGNVIQPFETRQAALEISGPANGAAELTVKSTTISGEIEREETQSVKLNAMGEARIELPWAETLASGIHLFETNISAETPTGRCDDRDFHRLTIVPFLANDFKHKNLFSGGAFISRYGNWSRWAEFFQRFGVGSLVAFDVESEGFYRAFNARNIMIFSSILHKGHLMKGLLEDPEEFFNIKNDYAKLSPSQLTKLEERCYQIAQAHPEVRVWKTLNEPGWVLMRESKETQGHMEAFIKTLTAVYRGIKRADPEMQVLSPDPANMYPTSGIAFVDKFLKAGGLDIVDIVAIHPYRPRPEEPDLETHTEAMLEMLARHHYTGELWFTEGIYHQIWDVPSYGLDPYAGCTSDSRRIASLSYHLTGGERMAAAYTMRSWLVALKHSDRVKNYVDWGFPNKYRALDYDFTPSATVFASHTLANLLGNSSFNREIKFGSGVRGYVFDDGRGRPVAALWTYKMELDRHPEKRLKMLLASLPANTELIQFDGKITKARETLEIGPLPVFLRGGEGEMLKLCEALDNAVFPEGGIAQFHCGTTFVSASILETEMKNLLTKEQRGTVKIVLNQKTGMESQAVLPSAGSQKYRMPVTLKEGALTPFSLEASFKKNGAAQAITSTSSFEAFTIPYLTQAPAMDCDPANWPLATKLSLPDRFVEFPPLTSEVRKKYPQNPKWQGKDDLSGTLYAGWDEDYLYLMVEVKDDRHAPVDKPGKAWQGDGLQIYFDCWGDGRLRNSSGVSSSYGNDDQSFMAWTDSKGQLKILRDVAPEQQVAFLKTGMVAKERLSRRFKRTAEGKSIYQITFPIKEITPAVLKKDSVIGLAILVNDRDNDFRKRAQTMTSPGTQPFRRPDLFPAAILTK
jgi:hypothetical protein